MDPMPRLSFCNILCAYVCLHEKCRVVVKSENLKQHLQRRHHVRAPILKREVYELLRAIEGKVPKEIATRYYKNPYPKNGETALPALSLLPLYDIVKCPCCMLYLNGYKACKSHVRSAHKGHNQFQEFMQSLNMLPLRKGQSLFRGHERLFFPVDQAQDEIFTAPLILSTEGSHEQRTSASDELSLRDKSANLTCSTLGISEFLEAQGLTLKKAYELSKINGCLHSKIISVFLAYIKHFCDMQPPVPMPIIEGIKIRNADKLASFSLSIELRSKRRYAAVAARFLVLTVKLGSHPLSNLQLDPEAKHIGEDLLETIDRTGSAPLNVVHSFFRTILLQKPRASMGELVLIEGLFKILIAGYTCGLQMRRVRVGDSDDASHTAAAMQYFCHITALGEFFVSPIGFGAEREEEENARFKRIQRLLSTESCSPTAYLRTVLLKTKRFSAGESPRIEFVTCPNHRYCGTVQNIEVQMNSEQPGSIGYVVRNLREDVRQTMRVELMQGFQVPMDFLSSTLSFPDKLNEKEPGYYFGAGLEARKKLQHWTEMFPRHIAGGFKPLIQEVELEGGTGHGPTVHASSWLRAVDNVSILLYVLVHLCGGGPPRVTEMIEAKLRNTAGSRRNLFLIKERLAIIGSYSKNSKQLQRPKPIARFLDHQTSELILLFVVFIKPVQCFFLKKSMLDLRATEDYLFCQSGEKINETNVCRSFAKALSSRGLPLNVSLYRHWRTGVAKAFLAEGSISTNERLLFLQAGHTEATARVRYAGGDFNVGDLSLAKLEGFYEVSKQWHKLIGITKNRSGHQAQGDQDSSHENQAKGRNLSISRSEEEHTAGGSTPVTDSVKNTLKRSFPDMQAVPQGKRPNIPNTLISNQSHSVAPMNLRDSIITCAKHLLQIPLQKDVQFKSEAQRAAMFDCALQTVLGDYTNAMIVVLPTGGGKTLCWAAAVLNEQRSSDTQGKKVPTTVLVVPLISLQQDMIRKCQKYGLRCGSWDERFKDGLSVVICSIDKSLSNDYNRFLVALSAQGRIARVVLDEAHLVLLWRELRRLDALGDRLRPNKTHPVPLICLSATLPNLMAIRLQEVLKIDTSCVKLYRALNSRPNISYQIQQVDFQWSKDMIRLCSKVLKTEMEGMKSSERIIVFCLTIKDCVDMHKSLINENYADRVCIYHGSMDRLEKMASYEKWIDKMSEVPIAMIATSAFSCGIDYPQVRTVIHVGGSRTIVELAQESGRAGRDGAPSKNIILYNSEYLENRMRISDFAMHERKEKAIFGDVKKVLENNNACRREVMESFLNNMNRGPCVGVELKCDICDFDFSSSREALVDQIPFGVPQRLHGNLLLPPNRKRITATPSVHRGNELRSTRQDQYPKQTTSTSVTGKCGSLGLPKVGSTTKDIEEVKWIAKQLSLAKCAVCLYSRQKHSNDSANSACMRAKCFRCMESNAVHQSKDCNVTPRSEYKTKRCFFCGIPQSKGLHENGSFNKRGKCEWEVSKNLALLMWRSQNHKHEMMKRVPELRRCRSVEEVGFVLCGGAEREERALLTLVMEYMYSIFVLGAKYLQSG